MPASSKEDISNKPLTDVVDDITRQAEQALKSGARATEEIQELKRRANEALDWRKQLDRHAGLILGTTIGLSFVIYLVARRH